MADPTRMTNPNGMTARSDRPDLADLPGIWDESVLLLTARVGSLGLALQSGAGCLPAGGVDRARAAIAKTAERTSIAGRRTVVALAGATGSGKSSLFNCLIGAEVAQVGARRPTTGTPTAAVWGSESASGLLDWLMVGARYVVDEHALVDQRRSAAAGFEIGPAGQPAPVVDEHALVDQRRSAAAGFEIGPAGQPAPVLPGAPGLDLDGLVLLDLPDFDSHATSHRVEAERVLDLVDVFIWVTDPQKYADARLHDTYIAKLSAHDAVTITVLNQADRLTPEARAACRGDLVRLLGADGVVDPEVIVTSAIDGRGVVDLRHRISEVVAGHHAAVRRLDSDLRSVATALRESVADSELTLSDTADASLVDALSRAAGIPIVLDAVEREFRRESWARTGWPFTRWARAFRPAPLKRLRLNRDRSESSRVISQSDLRSVLGRSSLPPATPAARSAVALATRELGDRAGRELPQAWTEAVSEAAMPSGEHLADALDQAVVHTSLRARNPLWWKVFGVLQGFFAVTAVAGLAWLVGLMVLGWLQFPDADPPSLGPLPYPFLMLAGGLFVGFLTAQLTRAWGRVGARRRKQLVAARLRKAVDQVARDRLVAPVQEVLNHHRNTREHLDTARAPQP